MTVPQKTLWKKEKNIQDWLDVQIEQTLISNKEIQPNADIESKVDIELGREKKEIVTEKERQGKIKRKSIERNTQKERDSEQTKREHIDAIRESVLTS